MASNDRQDRRVHFDGVLAFLDPLLAGAALVVEGYDLLGWAGLVGDDEEEPGIQFARMPFDLGDYPAWLAVMPAAS